MALKFNPSIGAIVGCDFAGLKVPEMTKRRPVIIISPRLRDRSNLCTIVPLSTTAPSNVMPYHYKLCLNPPLPAPYNNSICWVKGDMIYTLSMDRMHALSHAKDENGKRVYDYRII
ncbi:MAG: type II toxin-antitoxin system PemK/MazF family toxin [Candidatus Nitrotoga sp.]|nr:type II toxin-antitoxin system PemK/MazF family toxin [Candidatus Nitrotoga sp.]MDP1854449.1 type II toxin-antitoxin system PemK/MazF family toxin [Candidatus Nitrotoga sp.]